MGYYEEFPNLCFVDTLDNTGGLSYKGQQHSLFGLSSENAERIERQNSKKISVIIGNPPYNAKQPNYNYQNSNKIYKLIDKRIRDTYIQRGTAQNQIVVYDMYVRFIRWASDRISDDGVLCFITNNSYINGRAFDGFRRSISEEFQAAYFIDLGGNIRELSGRDGIWMNEEHTIFGVAAAVGISICFLIKKKDSERKPSEIYYIQPCDIRATRLEKIDWLKSHSFEMIPFYIVRPDKKHNWINQTDNDFDDLIPLIDKEVKAGKGDNAIFKKFSSGLKSQRDEWVYDLDQKALENKMRFFVETYQGTLADKGFKHKFQIKWDRELSKYLERGIEKSLDENQMVDSLYRPFFKMKFYYDRHFNGMT
jgi:predicted helicase